MTLAHLPLSLQVVVANLWVPPPSLLSSHLGNQFPRFQILEISFFFFWLTLTDTISQLTPSLCRAEPREGRRTESGLWCTSPVPPTPPPNLKSCELMHFLTVYLRQGSCCLHLKVICDIWCQRPAAAPSRHSTFFLESEEFPWCTGHFPGSPAARGGLS